MSTIVVGLYKEPRAAKKAFQALVAAGCQEKDLETFDGTGNADKAAEQLVAHGFARDVAERYGAAVKQGHTLVAADIADKDADAAEAIFDEAGAVELPESGKRPQKAADGKAVEEETVPVVEESVAIGKRRVSKGGLRVTTEVTETPVSETVRLHEEQVDVERRKTDRSLGQQEAQAAFEERTVEMTATSETPEVTKEARVVEEVVLSKNATERDQTVEAVARRTDVKVGKTEDRPAAKR
ncbi:YsnF/AvaK domain-containing protein [Azospirillum sp. RWY-5-1]|uniref:YsnF/AvaK domain-containing protein n=1 Tax=Azospirillum oleiclasticum TaxID=2735135 RepID=A0ABX2T5N1_9PROT|nr:YsnF/AvaK domain-containing protein [Azospirillum oleiclasticum]NYZ11446.1 YsnF/AvaK domain-containing protein [Azospirillum oleiclasticum]NYZ18607.1 YsnF/AvaK domain-containing protein [Azospirillum oleiclasticum]